MDAVVSLVRPRRTLGVAALGVGFALVAGACSGQRAAPVPTRPTPPPTITTTVPDTALDSDLDAVPGSAAPEASATGPDPRLPTTTVSAGPTTTLAPPSTEQWRRFDEALQRELIARGDYSASVAVRRQGTLLHTAAFGVRVPVLPPPTTPATSTLGPVGAAMPPATEIEPAEPTDRFRVASISKVITAAVVLQLVEAGQLQLDAPVGPRLAEALGVVITDPAVATVTARHLLSHTSGFGSHRSTFFGGGADSCAAAGRTGLSRGLERPPGTSYHYSNMNYCLLGLLIEAVTGESYETVAERQLLAPLGIEGMRMAGTFDPDPSEVEHPSTPGRNYMEALGGAGAWVATATDVVTIADSLEGSRHVWHPLSQDSMALMRVPAPTMTAPPAMRSAWYGLGEIVFADGSWGHTGTIENTHAMFLVRPDGVTWALLISGEYPGETDDIRGIVDDALAEAGIRL